MNCTTASDTSRTRTQPSEVHADSTRSQERIDFLLLTFEMYCLFQWFEDMFDRMPRDGRETQWRFLCESEQPELSKLPDKMDTQLTKLQRLLIIRAVRSDRLLHLSSLFVSDVLGARYEILCARIAGLDLWWNQWGFSTLCLTKPEGVN